MKIWVIVVVLSECRQRNGEIIITSVQHIIIIGDTNIFSKNADNSVSVFIYLFISFGVVCFFLCFVVVVVWFVCL